MVECQYCFQSHLNQIELQNVPITNLKRYQINYNYKENLKVKILPISRIIF
jgi:hypothetical protein